VLFIIPYDLKRLDGWPEESGEQPNKPLGTVYLSHDFSYILSMFFDEYHGVFRV